MPKDKKLSHSRVLEAAKQEFLEKGFEGASIRQKIPIRSRQRISWKQ